MKKIIFIIFCVFAINFSSFSQNCTNHVLHMYDSYGDGWNGNYFELIDTSGFVFFSTTLNNGSYGTSGVCISNNTCFGVFCSGGSWQYEVSWELRDLSGNIVLSGGAPYTGLFGCIFGCTNPFAGNYDPLANADDGSCISSCDSLSFQYINSLPSDSLTCDGVSILNVYSNYSIQSYLWTDLSDSIISNNDFALNLCNGVYFVNVTDTFGCITTDTLFFGSIYGCTDPQALNYDWFANVDNGSCIQIIYGCIDSLAYNFDSLATVDDGSCCYLEYLQIGQDITPPYAVYDIGDISLNSQANIVAISYPKNGGNTVDRGYVRVHANFGNVGWSLFGNTITGNYHSELGTSMDLSSDGLTLVVSSPKEAVWSPNHLPFAGLVNVYQYDNGNWNILGQDLFGDSLNTFFGSSVTINSLGNRIAVAYNEFTSYNQSNLNVKVFEYNSGSWIQIGSDITGPSYNNIYFSSEYVKIEFDSLGENLVLGTDIDNTNGTNSGSVLVWNYDGINWNQVGLSLYGNNGEKFGSSVDISNDGNIIAVGAPFNYSNGTQSGTVRLYEKISSNWVQIGQDIYGESANDLSGESISLNANGNIIAIGAVNNDAMFPTLNSSNRGHVRVYENISGVWTQKGQDIDGENQNDGFGYKVSISDDGSTLAVGSENFLSEVLRISCGGCIDPLALNFDSLAEFDDGSCIYIEGCSDSLAHNFNPNAITNNGSCIYCDLSNNFVINNNSTGNCDGFIISNPTTSYPPINYNWNNGANGTNIINLCPSLYILTLTDNIGCILVDSVIMNVILGCTDSLAANYNLSATYNDGTCCYLGCTDSNSVNYNPLACVDDSSCIPCIYGCTDSLSCNYNLLATCDNGSCLLLYGCTDSLSFNFDALATCDDGSCCYLSGCIDPNAVNYDPNACFDDGSCCYDIGQFNQTVSGPHEFGKNVEFSEDGLTMAVVFDSIISGTSIGSVRIYRSNGINWYQIGSTIVGDTSYIWGSSDGIESVSLNNDGNILIVGSRYALNPFGHISGKVRTYEYVSDDWSIMGQDIYGDGTFDLFGFSVDINSDGNIIAVGSPEMIGSYQGSGYVKIFEYISGSWVNFGLINGEHVADAAGYSVSLSKNGDIIAIGSPLESNSNGNHTGHVRIFENISGFWFQIGQNINGEGNEDNSGESISLNANGNIVAIGAVNNDAMFPTWNSSNRGHVRVYENISGVWTQKGQDIDGENQNDEFGFKVSLSGDGNVVAIGVPGHDGNGTNSGYVQIYSLDTNYWTQIYQNIEGNSLDRCGEAFDISIDGNRLVNGISDVNFGTVETFIINNTCVLGCTDTSAFNYDSLAVSDDGSCIYVGCTDPNAANYNPLATIDDGSCLYCVYGCMDSTALNYDPTATCDDGSCTYSSNCTSPKPTGLYAYDVIDIRAKIGWDNMNDPNCMVWKYFVRYREVGTGGWTTKSAGVGNGLWNFGLNTVTKQLLNLSPSTTYEFKMKAFYCGGTSSNYSTPVQFTTADPCPDMTNLTTTTFNGNQSKVRFNWDTTGVYTFARVLLRVDTAGANWQTAGGFGVYYPTLFVNKFGLQSGESYRAQGRTFCDSNITAYRSPTWTSPIFWTQPGTIRLSGGASINNLDIYPNPSRDIFNITFTSEKQQDLRIRILSVVGAEVYKEDRQEFIGEYTKQISLDNYGKGIYFLEIETSTGIINKKLILQ